MIPQIKPNNKTLLTYYFKNPKIYNKSIIGNWGKA